jgi:septum formation protein
MSAREANLILASGSPQRKQLLAQAGYSFDVMVPGEHAECGVCSQETPGELVARLARQKAADVRAQLASRQSADCGSPPGASTACQVIVACDTVAECLGQILGKPRDRQHARQMLELLSGREHRVYSGLCLSTVDPPQAALVRVARTTLRMDPLSPEQIDEYLDSGQWEGKAGAFGYQDRFGWLHLTEGSESNVIGLPLELLAEMLREYQGLPLGGH